MSSQLDSVLASAADCLYRQGAGEGAAAVDAARRLISRQVVPCDDEAIERMAECLYDMDDERVRVDGVEWANEPDGYRGVYRDKVREIIAAAIGLSHA